MNKLHELAINLIEDLPAEKLSGVITYLEFVKSQPTPLDDFDYELSRRYDEHTEALEYYDIEDVAKEYGIHL